jgi:flagellar motor switch protein FliN
MSQLSQNEIQNEIQSEIQSGHVTEAAQIIELSPLPAMTPSGPPLMAGNLNLLHGVKVTLSVTVGEIQTTLGELMGLQQQSVLKIERPVEGPVDLILDGKIVARGQLVVVEDNFGVRITEIASAS